MFIISWAISNINLDPPPTDPPENNSPNAVNSSNSVINWCFYHFMGHLQTTDLSFQELFLVRHL